MLCEMTPQEARKALVKWERIVAVSASRVRKRNLGSVIYSVFLEAESLCPKSLSSLYLFLALLKVKNKFIFIFHLLNFLSMKMTFK